MVAVVGSMTIAAFAAFTQYGWSQAPAPAATPKQGSIAGGHPSPKADRSVTAAPSKHMRPSPELIAQRNHLWAPARKELYKGWALMKKGDFAGAETAARKCIDLTPDTEKPLGGAYFLIGDALMEKGDYQNALTSYNRGSGNTWRAGQDLSTAICLVRLGRFDEARAAYSDEKILKYNLISKADLPGIANARALEASLLLARGLDRHFSNLDLLALEDFKAVKRLAPNNPIAAYHSAKALESLGRRDEAIADYKIAAKSGKSEFAKDAISQIR
jgi:tetratricopeptide (TPR) repeat protein